ncbi:MAG: hypothetical protein DWI02_10635 [Planctomycetota bacterium]|nr:MAG: hypothetical protein DWI02_10635 [Planctomycetota bacterium]
MADSPSDQLDDACESRLNEKKGEAVGASVTRGGPFGSDVGQENTPKHLGQKSKFRSRGRPRKTMVHQNP